MLLFLYFCSKKFSAGRRIMVIFQLEILKPGNEIDFLIGQPNRLNADFTNNLSEMVEGLTLRPSNSQNDTDDDSIHFREFDELDIFHTWYQHVHTSEQTIDFRTFFSSFVNYFSSSFPFWH